MNESLNQSPEETPAGISTDPSVPAAPIPNRGGRPRRVRVWPEPEKFDLPSLVRKMRAKETGKGVDLLAAIVSRHPNDAIKQLGEFFSQFRITAMTGRARPVSHKTELRYYKAIASALDTLRELNMRIQNLTELSTKHVRSVTRAWEQQDRSASDLANLNTSFRRLGIWMGKPDLAPLLSELLEDPASGYRPTSTTEPRSWESQRVNPEDVFAAMERECPITAMQLRLGWAFGLRAEEQVMFRPQESHKDDTLYIFRGTKGGKVRTVKLKEPWEFDLIERAKAMASKDPERNPLAILSPNVRNLKRALKRYYYLCSKIGLTKTGRFGTTPHGARHSFACRRYQWQCGFPAPVLGGMMAPREVDSETRLLVSKELGHERRNAASAYISTEFTMRRLTRANRERLMDLDRRLSEDSVLLNLVRDARVTTFCVCGPAAMGEKLPSMVNVFCEGAEPIPANLMTAIVKRCAELLRTRCVPVTREAVEISNVETFEVLALSRASSGGPNTGQV